MANRQIILITGGSGLIGRRLQTFFGERGHEVRLLGRGYRGKTSEGKFYWDPARGEMDESALEGVTWLVNLAGEPVLGKRWATAHKTRVLESRLAALRLLREGIRRTGHVPQKMLSASAVGYYGALTTPHVFTETDPPGNDFLADVCVRWEAEANALAEEFRLPVVLLRIGVVLAREGGALQEIAGPMRKFGLGTVLGSGKQWVPWIHIDDLAGIANHILETPGAEGPYHGVSSSPATFAELARAAARSLGKGMFPIPVPGFVIRTALGEQADIVLRGSRISAQKVTDSGYRYRFTDVQTACDDLLKNA